MIPSTPGSLEEFFTAHVLLDLGSSKIDRPFTYLVPKELQSTLTVGSQVLAPFRARLHVGYVIGFGAPADSDPRLELRPIVSVLDPVPLFSSEILELSRWLSQTTCAPWVECIRCLIPTGILFRIRELAVKGDVKTGEKLSPLEEECLAELEQNLPAERALLEKGRDRRVIAQLLRKGALSREYKVDAGSLRPKKQTVIRLSPSQSSDDLPEDLTILRMLAGKGLTLSALARETGLGKGKITRLIREGLLEKREETVIRGMEKEDGSPSSIPSMTEAQEAAFSAIRRDLKEGREAVHLIHGVTGSGKTEVYMRAVEETLSLGRAALVLVPEISLTPQTVGRFRRRFGGHVAVLHSALSGAERYDQWRTIREGKVRIAIGARSAIFAPLENLGLIVVDEEHEGSYKQGNSPRYEARQVARQRIKSHKAVLVLGSATPSVESYFAGLTKELPVSRLPERIGGRPLPSVSIVDMREELSDGNKSIFSAPLSAALEECISRKEQVMLFLNRRGFATFVLCRECGAGIKCRFCAVSLTFHQEDRSLRCHHCDFRMPAPKTCPHCGSTYFRQFGTGTERVLEEFLRRFPGIACARLDRDAARRKGSLGKILGAFERKEVQVLIGTQMIAKGLDFPGVALVGVISADTLLHLPDFRASERTYQLLTQVSGRAGRGEVPGRVVIQTYEPEHPALTAVILGEEGRFYEEELKWREELGYPPFTRLANLVIAAPGEEDASRAAGLLRKILEDIFPGELSLKGPAPCPFSLHKGMHRWHVTAVSPPGFPLEDPVREGVSQFRKRSSPSGLRLLVDMDPVSLL